MADLSYFKTAPGILTLVTIVGCIFAIALGVADEGGTDGLNLDNGKQAYVFSAVCITLVIVAILLILHFLGKLSDDRISTVALAVCLILMVIACFVILDIKGWFDKINLCFISVCITTSVLAFQVLLKLGMVKA